MLSVLGEGEGDGRGGENRAGKERDLGLRGEKFHTEDAVLQRSCGVSVREIVTCMQKFKTASNKKGAGGGGGGGGGKNWAYEEERGLFI